MRSPLHPRIGSKIGRSLSIPLPNSDPEIYLQFCLPPFPFCFAPSFLDRSSPLSFFLGEDFVEGELGHIHEPRVSRFDGRGSRAPDAPRSIRGLHSPRPVMRWAPWVIRASHMRLSLSLLLACFFIRLCECSGRLWLILVCFVLRPLHRAPWLGSSCAVPPHSVTYVCGIELPNCMICEVGSLFLLRML